VGRLWVIGKKIFSVSLIFNALLTVASCLSILGGVYWHYSGWKPFHPYLIDGNIFWFAIAAAVINIFPSARLGRDLHTGRFLFHHYFYGFLVLVCAAVYVMLFTPASLLTIFFTDDTSVAVNLGRFFIIGGLALLLDDLPDVSEKMDSALNWLKMKAHSIEKIVSAVQMVVGAVSLYLFVAVSLSVSQNIKWLTLANFILLGTIFITGVTSFIFVKRGAWKKPEINQQNAKTVH
jgi:hypothetical protein